MSNYKDGWFQNDSARPKLLGRHNPFMALAGRRETLRPSYSLPWVSIDLNKLPAPAPTLVWFGHSSVLIKTEKANILIDPVFSDHAGPVPGLVTAFKGTTHYHAKDMPP
ncbi:MBL fold metallo-hydrolase [Mucilaginibacter antarcticus]|uniref:MBL fold metallo-hydrolase n=1 Tax=Mucilaginibacter antarcticus TaxID=1855725 RepID=UPI0036288BEC